MSETEPSWDLYGAFLAVMQGGSLSAAARSLGVAQPTVRRQVEQLEQQLGVVLFTRAPNGLVPTELARATLPYAESLAATARALVRSVSGSTAADRGTVRVTCSEVVGVEASGLGGLRDRAGGVHDLGAAAVVDAELQGESGVGLALFLCLFELADHRLPQLRPAARPANAHAHVVQLVAAAMNHVAVEPHQPPHLVGRAAPVLGRERVRRQVLQADLDRTLDHVEQGVLAASVAVGAG